MVPGKTAVVLFGCAVPSNSRVNILLMCITHSSPQTTAAAAAAKLRKARFVLHLNLKMKMRTHNFVEPLKIMELDDTAVSRKKQARNG